MPQTPEQMTHTHHYPLGTFFLFPSGNIWKTITPNRAGDPQIECVHTSPNSAYVVGYVMSHFNPAGWPLFHSRSGERRVFVVAPCDCPRHQGRPTFHQQRT